MKSIKLSFVFSSLFLGLLALPACTTPGKVLETAERKWQKYEITSYKIEVLVVNSIWHAQTHTVTVLDGDVADSSASCNPAPFEGGVCKVVAYVAEDFTVPGLFMKARSEIESEDSTFLKITFDSTYGFPERISFDDPEILDEDWSWVVTSFKVLSP